MHVTSWIRQNIFLIFIFFIALSLRLIHLDALPMGFYEEEVTNAYVGRFILDNGVDLHGNPWPILYFDKFGDFPPVLPSYLSGLSTYVFGFTAFAARFPVALIGALTVFPLFGLAMMTLRDKRYSTLAAGLLAISPWHIVLSRTTAEGIVGLAVFVWAIVLFVAFVNQKKHLMWPVGLLILTYFLYPSFRIIVPLSVLVLAATVFWQKKHQRKQVLLVGVFFLIITVLIATTTWGRGRFEQTSLFKSGEVASHVGLRIQSLAYGDGSGNVIVARIFHNKIVEYGKAFLHEYLRYFNPEHLFLEVQGQPRYFNVPHVGLVFFITGVFIFLALLPMPTKADTRRILFILGLLALSILPAAVTVDFPPHAHRAIVMIVPLLLLASWGAQKVDLFSSFKRLILAACLVVLALEGVYFWHQYSVHADANQSVLRNDGDRQLAAYLIDNHTSYDTVIVPAFERIPIYYLYFSGTTDASLAGRFAGGLQLDTVDNVEFYSDWCPSKMVDYSALPSRTLIVDGGDCSSSELIVLETIMRTDSTKAYRIQSVIK